MNAFTDLSSAGLSRPCLPEGMTLSHVIELVERNARRINLGPARREVLLRLIRRTSPGDWTAPDRDPVCFCAQQDLAHELGITDRVLRNHELRLAARSRLPQATGSRQPRGPEEDDLIAFDPRDGDQCRYFGPRIRIPVSSCGSSSSMSRFSLTIGLLACNTSSMSGKPCAASGIPAIS